MNDGANHALSSHWRTSSMDHLRVVVSCCEMATSSSGCARIRRVRWHRCRRRNVQIIILRSRRFIGRVHFSGRRRHRLGSRGKVCVLIDPIPINRSARLRLVRLGPSEPRRRVCGVRIRPSGTTHAYQRLADRPTSG